MKTYSDYTLNHLNKHSLIKIIKELYEENQQLRADYGNIAQVERDLLEQRIDEAIEYIKKYRQIYDIDGSIEKQLDDFNILASPKDLLNILQGNKEK